MYDAGATRLTAIRVRNRLSRVVGVTYAIPLVEEIVRYNPEFATFVDHLSEPMAVRPNAATPETTIDRAKRLLAELNGSPSGPRKRLDSV